MKAKYTKILCLLLSCILVCGCSSTTDDYSGFIYGNHHIRKADMGYSPAQVMASESADFVEELTPKSKEIIELFGTDSKVSGLTYYDKNVAGHSAEIRYFFLEDKLVLSAVYLNPLYPGDLFTNLASYYEGEFGYPGESLERYSSIISSAYFWEQDGYGFAVALYDNNYIVVMAYNPKTVSL